MGKTYKDIAEKLKRETIEHNMVTFANSTIGVHGKELPKFSESPHLEYWKLHPGVYNPSPANNSLISLNQKIKYWAKPDVLRLTDNTLAMPSPDPLKTVHVSPVQKPSVVTKITQLTQEPGDSAKFCKSHRWSEEMLERYQSVYAYKPELRPSLIKLEGQPLYSSFSPDLRFSEKFAMTSPMLYCYAI